MLEFVIPCLLGLESLVGDEIRKLGLSDVRVENGRVLCRGEARDIARLNINLRCGARVILVLHKFRATDFESLFQGVRAVHWEDWIPREGEFPVVGYSINSTLHSVPACQSIVKKAVVDRLSAAYGIAQLKFSRFGGADVLTQAAQVTAGESLHVELYEGELDVRVTGCHAGAMDAGRD